MYQINKSSLSGCLELIPKVFKDYRGISVKPFHIEAFKELGIEYNFREDLLAISQKGVLRGLHFQNPPYAQAKLIYCINGSIMDVVLDIRKGSPTYGKYETFHITGAKNNMIYIPEGFAHGYLTLEDKSIVMYKMSSVYKPESEDGIKWDSVDIPWGIKNPKMSDRDKGFLSFEAFKSEFRYK